MGDTSIEWTDKTWNPVRGCTEISPGCKNCYAKGVAVRFSGKGEPYAGLSKFVTRESVRRRDLADGGATLTKVETRTPLWTGEVRFVAEHLADPLRWRKPRRIFVNSMSDLFHEGLTNEQIAAVFGVMCGAKQHMFQVLTKRAARMAEWFDWAERADLQGIACAALDDAGFNRGCGSAFDPDAWPLTNVWLGVSTEDQAAAEERVPLLLKTPAAVRFLSAEPLLEAIDLDPMLQYPGFSFAASPSEIRQPWLGAGRIDWVIAGCESGRGARPAQVDWYRSLRDQCATAGTAFFLKQARTRDPVRGVTLGEDGIAGGDGSHYKAGGIIGAPYLDGRQHLAFPAVAP